MVVKGSTTNVQACARLPILSRAANAVTIAIGVVVLLAWTLDLYHQVPLSPSMVVMNPVAALMFICIGISLWWRGDPPNYSSSSYRLLRLLLAGLVVLAAALRLLDSLTRLPFHVDRLLFPARLALPGPFPPAGMAPNTALGLMFCGIAMILFHVETRRGFVPAQCFILAAGLLALLAIIGHVYHVLLLNRLGSALPMSLDTAIALLFFCLSFLATQPRRGFMAVISSSTVGGTMARRLLPMAVFVPWLLGLLLLLGEQAGYYSRESALSLFAAIIIVIFTVLIWWNAKLLHLADLERAHAEEQLRQASLNLQRSNTDLEQFAYVASHDLFEPLRMVTSYLQLLRQQYRGRLDKQADEFIDFAIDGAKRMAALIHDLLVYSRVDIRGRSFEPVDCEEAFQAALVNLKVAIEESGAAINRKPLPKVVGDRVQLTQVFQNLLGNALKFRGSGPPVIEISAERRDNDWLFSVKDNGIGIDPKDFNRVFVIFQRLHTRQEYPGTGIGLSLCKKIIERHGGDIWIESLPGRGSTFFFTLPALPS